MAPGGMHHTGGTETLRRICGSGVALMKNSEFRRQLRPDCLQDPPRETNRRRPPLGEAIGKFIHPAIAFIASLSNRSPRLVETACVGSPTAGARRGGRGEEDTACSLQSITPHRARMLEIEALDEPLPPPVALVVPIPVQVPETPLRESNPPASTFGALPSAKAGTDEWSSTSVPVRGRAARAPRASPVFSPCFRARISF